MTFVDDHHLAKLQRTYEAVVYAHAQVGDDNCWMDITKVYEAAGLPPKDKSVGNPAAMLLNCEHYLNHVCTGGGPWISYRELLEENRRLKKQLERIHDTF